MKDPTLTRRVASEAARLLARDEAASVDAARRKAAARLGVRGRTLLPDDSEILAELAAYQALFGGAVDQGTAARRLQLARDAMAFMHAFRPEFAEHPGQIVPKAETPLRILLYADDPDAVLRHLLEAGTRHRIRRSRLLRGAARALEVDVLEVLQGGAQFEFWPLPPAAQGEPLSDTPLGAPLPRLPMAAVDKALSAFRAEAER